jgi:hypothetical protein
MTTYTGEFSIAAWDEDTYAEPGPERKLTEAKVSQEFTGDVSGSGEVRFLMCYDPDGTAQFVGLQKIDGTIEGRTGGFVLQTIGQFDGQVATATWTVIPGSGTDGLAGISGEGRFRAPMGETPTYALEARFE